MNDNTDSFGVRAKRTATRLITVLVILGLVGVAGVLLSQLNARTFTLVEENGSLAVMKGRMMPVGAVAYHPSDPALADAYAPLPLEGTHAQALTERRFSERDELDRALFDVIAQLAKPRLAGEDPQELERGLYFVRRAERLSGLTEEQRTTLKQMQAEVSFYLARTKLDDARRLISEALNQLHLASESNNHNARSAHQMIAEVEPTAKAMEESLRKAVHTLSAPPDAPNTTPAPPPATDSAVTSPPQQSQAAQQPVTGSPQTK